MARSKEFDVDVAIEQALDLFWTKGYEATSMQDLVDHLGIHRGSLYGAFGSKDNLYRLALDRYRADGQVIAGSIMNPEGSDPMPHDKDMVPSVRDRIEVFLSSAIDDPDGRGCFIVNTVCERNHHDQASFLATKAALDDWRQNFRVALESADKAGALAAGTTPAIGAEMLLVLAQGVRVLTKAGGEQHVLRDVVASTLDQILPTTQVAA